MSTQAVRSLLIAACPGQDKNPLYETMAEAARDLAVEWLKNDPRSVVGMITSQAKVRGSAACRKPICGMMMGRC